MTLEGEKDRFYEWNWATFGGGLRMKDVDWEGKGRSELVDEWGGWEGMVWKPRALACKLLNHLKD